MSIFKSCDVRGIVDQDWDAGDALRIGLSLGLMLRARGQQSIVGGGDLRRSTPRLKTALIDGLVGAGIDVEDVGQVPTPVVQFAARHLAVANLAIVTASHNPGVYNGIKFLVDGRPPVPAVMQELEQRLATAAPAARRGKTSRTDILPEYEAWVSGAARELVTRSNRADTPASHHRHSGSAAQTRVVVDTMGGAFTGLAPRVLSAAGYETLELDPAVDPDFARRDPNPARDRNLLPLIDAVVRHRADLGVALDGDGDRVVFVDARGQIARPEQIAVLLVEHCFPGGTVVYDLKCASIVSRAAQAGGGRSIMQPSGHGFIKATMLDTGAELGVEVSGHHFFGLLGGGDDGLFTALVVLGLLRQLGTPLHDEVARIGWPAITPDVRVAYEGDRGAVLAAIAARCGGRVSQLDGIRAEYTDGWALARASITEPALTFRFESTDRQQWRAMVARFLAGAPDLLPRVLEHVP
ncbi:MAG: hypothetical protein MUF48_19665 [Pirellulaceae bacterium]|nr:hypothetical protein [Pirellulaceae bacterium]